VLSDNGHLATVLALTINSVQPLGFCLINDHTEAGVQQPMRPLPLSTSPTISTVCYNASPTAAGAIASLSVLQSIYELGGLTGQVPAVCRPDRPAARRQQDFFL